MDGVLARLYVATFLYAVAQALAIPLVTPLLDLEFGASVRFIGLVLGVYGLMQIVLRLPMGDMADRRGRKPSLVLAFASTFVAGLFFAGARDAWWVIPGVAFLGFAGGVFWVAANSYLFDRVGPGQVARATSDYSMAVGLSFLVGPPLGHVLADHFGFRVAFLLVLVASALGLLLVLSLPEDRRPPRPRDPVSPYVRAARLLRHPALVMSAAGTFLYSILFATMTSFFELHVLAVGLSVTAAGLLLGGRQLSATLVRLGLPRVLDRLGAVRVLFGGVVAAAVATALVPFATGVPALVGVIALAGAATGVMIPANLMLVHEGAPPGERGLANGIYGTMLGLGQTVAPVAFGAMGDRYGLPWTFWAAGATSLLLALGVALAWRGRQPTASKAAPP